MIRTRVAAAVLIGGSLMTVTACGGDKSATTSAPSTLAPSSAAPVASSSSPATGSDVTAGDKELCQAANKVDKASKAELMKAVKADGNLDLPQVKKYLTILGKQLDTAAAGSDSKVAAAMKAVAALSA